MADPRSDRPIEERASFESIRYGSVWEDADVLCEALAPVAEGGDSSPLLRPETTRWRC